MIQYKIKTIKQNRKKKRNLWYCLNKNPIKYNCIFSCVIKYLFKNSADIFCIMQIQSYFIQLGQVCVCVCGQQLRMNIYNNQLYTYVCVSEGTCYAKWNKLIYWKSKKKESSVNVHFLSEWCIYICSRLDSILISIILIGNNAYSIVFFH